MEQKSFLFENVVYEQLIEDFESHFNADFRFSNSQNTTTILIIKKYSLRSTLSIILIFNRYNNNSVELHIVISGVKGAETLALNYVIKFVKQYAPLKWGI